MKDFRKKILLISFLFLFLLNYSCQAEESISGKPDASVIPPQEEAKPRTLQGIEFLTGYSFARIHAKNDLELNRDYNSFPIIVDFDFNLKDLTKKIGFNPPVLLQFQIEPYIAAVAQPDANIEVGTSFMFKLGLVPETWKLQPFIKVGAGMVYMSQHTREQSTQFNFIESGVFGVHYFFTKNTAFTLEGRMRHLSNASIKQPNHGINSYQGLAGISYRY